MPPAPELARGADAPEPARPRAGAPRPPRILFASPCGPYPRARAGEDPFDFFYYRNTLGQGPLMLRSFQSWYPLHLLAQNLPAPSTVLENPSPAAFRREVRGGGYQVVAITFTVPLVDRVLEMVRAVRAEAPGALVVLGGYGTAVFQAPDATAMELRGLADAVCSGEGVGFMRAFLAERFGLAAPAAPGPLRQDLTPARHSLFRTRLPLFRQLVLVGALGCPHACGFCATSAQFGGRRIELASGEELAAALERQRLRHPGIASAILYDEDFLLDRKRFLAFLSAVEASPALRERPVDLTVFASARSLERCTVEEVVRAGVGTVYVGVESLSDQVLDRERLDKRAGDLERWFGRLHAHGIHTFGSLVVGWDGMDAAATAADVDRFVRLSPTFYQVVPLHPIPGTALWASLDAQGRLDRSAGFPGDQVGRFRFRLCSLAPEVARAEVARAYRALVAEGGPWPFRLVENLVRGIGTLGASPDERLRRRAAHHLRTLRAALPLAAASGLLFHGRGFRRRWRAAMREALALAPLTAAASVAAAPLVALGLTVVHALAQARYWLSPWGDQPDEIRAEYPRAPRP